MLFNEAGEIMLIRNSYGRSDLFVLPGGGIRPFETPDQAARREVREELGCDAEAVELLGTYASNAQGKRDAIHLFIAQASGEARADQFEVVEATFFDLDQIPDSISPATRRRIDEYLGARTADGHW